MKKLYVMALATLVPLAAMAEEVDRTLDAAADGSVHISNISGSVKVDGWNRDEVQVKGFLGRNVEELIFDRDGDRITIKVKVPKKGSRDIKSDLRVSVPRESSIDVATVSADIEVEGVRGYQKLEAVSGDIDTEAFESDVRAGTVSGDVEVRGQGEDTETHGNSVSGDVVFYRLSGQVTAESVSGDIEIEGGAFDRAGFNTVNGDIEFVAELRSDGKLTAETVNGEVDLDFQGTVSGRFDIDTFNGDISNCFGPKPERTSKYAPGQELSFQEGKGDARVTVSTMNGDVSICR
ncbi:MAG: DUF4097 family beta strand repeat-containing protein [Woeseiaceae bacterium]|jgi:DUF4097 and DUF4098 domain-containing protein YvlB